MSFLYAEIKSKISKTFISFKVLNEYVLKCLDLNEYMTDIVPLHLQLYKIDISKQFRRQSLILQHRVPILPYFETTCKNLGLRIPPEETEPKLDSEKHKETDSSVN
jgi:hypothetical protein